MLLDASAGGSITNKVEREARTLIEAMAQNEYRVQNDRGAKKKAGMLDLDTGTTLLAQQAKMNNNIESLLKVFINQTTPPAPVNAAQGVQCDFCGQGHANGGCFPAGSEQANYLANYMRIPPNNDPFSATYNPGWRDHPNFGWGGNKNQNSNQSQQQAPQQNNQQRSSSALEDTLSQFIKVTQGNFESMKISQDQREKNQDLANKNHEASIRNLETQIGQLSRQFSAAQNNGFEGSTKNNPRNETCNAINLRSGVVPSSEVVMKKKREPSGEGVNKKGNIEEEEKNESKGEVEKEWEVVEVSKSDDKELVENQREKISEKSERDKERAVLRKEIENRRRQAKKDLMNNSGPKEVSPYAKLPYSRAPKKEKSQEKVKSEENTFRKFMEMFNSLQIDIPFAEVLEQMPLYAKFMKELLTKKRKPKEDASVLMNEECSAMVQAKLS
jgi:hypothetical protein